MRINGFRCDFCHKEHLLDPTLAVTHVVEQAPPGWYVVFHNYQHHDSASSPQTFCSLACLHNDPIVRPPAALEVE